MRLGMIGLGRMGAGMAERLRRAGHEVIGYDRNPAVSEASSLGDLVVRLGASPRVAWVMLPAGEATESTIRELAALLSPGDLVVDGGNSNFHDSRARGAELAPHGIGFVDAGVSGGIWGLAEGYCLMVGGDAAHVALIRPALEALAQPDGFAHVGPVGAGHFTKMVHNGVEYGLMQAYGEGYELLTESDMDVDVNAALRVWRHGSVVRSWLLDLLVRALEDDPGLASIEPTPQDSGEGRWTVEEAIRLGVPVPVIAASLFARFASRNKEPGALKVVAALRGQFGGHAVRS